MSQPTHDHYHPFVNPTTPWGETNTQQQEAKKSITSEKYKTIKEKLHDLDGITALTMFQFDTELKNTIVRQIVQLIDPANHELLVTMIDGNYIRLGEHNLTKLINEEVCLLYKNNSNHISALNADLKPHEVTLTYEHGAWRLIFN